MPNEIGLGGSDLYNILKEAQEKNFKSNKFSVADSANESPTTNVGSNVVKGYSFNKNNRQVTGLDISKYTDGIKKGVLFDKLPNFSSVDKTPTYDDSGTQYDMFERNAFKNIPNGVGIADAANDVSFVSKPSNGIDNKLIINYKNNINTGIIQVNGKNVFVNSVLPNNLYKKVNYKDASIDKIVNLLSQNSPAAKISYADFLYCKKLGAFPNNRLVILRRFFQPVEDDLNSSISNKNQNPLSVMVTWFDEFPLQITFGEEWATYAGGGLTQEISNTFNSLTSFLPLNKIGISSKTKEFLTDATNQNQGDTVSSPWLKTLWYQFIDKLYKNDSNNIPPHFKDVLTEANPNLIRESVYKKGLKCSLQMSITFSYVMRYINGIDQHVAMHNIIANAIRMGTSTSVTIFPKSNSFLPSFVTDLNEGKIITALSNILLELGKFIDNVQKDVKNTLTPKEDSNKNKNTNLSQEEIKKNVGQSLKNVESKFGQQLKQLFSLYRFKLTAALQQDMGLASGVWHLTIGNPFNPIVSVGDLILKEQMSMTFGKELSYDDQPTEVNFTINLSSARNRGAQEIEQIFNAGRGRIYVYPKLEDDPDLYLSGENPQQTKS